MTVEDQLRQALSREAAAVPEPADQWGDIEARADAIRRAAARSRARRRRRGITALAVAAVATAAAAAIALPALTHEPTRRVVVTPAHSTTVVTRPPTPQTTTPTSLTATTGTGPGAGSAPGQPVRSGYQPLYPFRSLQEAAAWEASYRVSGVQPWHLDPGATALGFTGFLGYTDVTEVFAVRMDASGAHVTVGFPNPNGAPVDSAVVHLRRFGTTATSPWEVVGTDDTVTFSIATPGYGTIVSSPFSVGGAIMGVDENIKVQVWQLSSPTPVGLFCCQPAGSAGTPWKASIALHGATDNVLIVAASTGGHLATVERFTVTGVRTAAGSTPGL